MTMTS